MAVADRGDGSAVAFLVGRRGIFFRRVSVLRSQNTQQPDSLTELNIIHHNPGIPVSGRSILAPVCKFLPEENESCFEQAPRQESVPTHCTPDGVAP